VACPLCGAEFHGDAFVRHLADAHDLVDDEGTTSCVEPARETVGVAAGPAILAPGGLAPAAPLPGLDAPWVAPSAPSAPAAPPAPSVPGPEWMGALPPPPSRPPPSFGAPAPAGRRASHGQLTVFALVAVAALVALGILAYKGHQAPSDVSASGSPTSPAAPGGPPTSIAPVLARSANSSVSVDPDEAKEVARQLWLGHMQALHEQDIPGLRNIESGAALEADIGVICVCGASPPAPPIAQVIVNVPHQTAWPAHFFASVIWTDGCTASAQCVDSFVAVQQNVEAPWTLDLYAAYSGLVMSEEPQLGAWGFAADPPPLTDAGAGNLPSEYAAYFQSVYDTGRPPAGTRLVPGPFTDGQDGARHHAPDHDAALGFSQTGRFWADPAGDPVYVFATSGGSTTVCGTIRYEITYTALAMKVIAQPPDRAVLDFHLDPGQYSSVVEHGLYTACFAFDPNVPQQVGVFGGWGGLTSIGGVTAG
jgi:hypothetical protein